jgi:hypothetical protein
VFSIRGQAEGSAFLCIIYFHIMFSCKDAHTLHKTVITILSSDDSIVLIRWFSSSLRSSVSYSICIKHAFISGTSLTKPCVNILKK